MIQRVCGAPYPTHNFEGTCIFQLLYFGYMMKQGGWKTFLIHALSSSNIMSNFTLNYQHLSVVIKCVFNYPILSYTVLINY